MEISYINYKKISYILSETPSLSGNIAFVFLNKILEPNDVLKFTFYEHEKESKSTNSLLQMYDDIVILPSKNNEKEFIVNNINLNNDLLDFLCLSGKFPNFLTISKINSNIKSIQKNYYWSIEYCDEIFTFIYKDTYIDSSKIILIEQELKNKEISYERKKIRNIKFKLK